LKPDDEPSPGGNPLNQFAHASKIDARGQSGNPLQVGEESLPLQRFPI
jgi:hypothetical protein